MVDVTISDGRVRFVSSVLGAVDGAFNAVELVDESMLHLVTGTEETGPTTHLLNVVQFSFNGQTFSGALDAVSYIESIV